MKIKLYIVTYNNNDALNQTLQSLFNSNVNSYNIDIYIINNHTNFFLREEFQKVNVLHNIVRPNFSTGHLARDWNCALINGFKDLKCPDCDIVVTCQNDTVFSFDWINKLISLHNKYSFITACPGDGFCSYLPDAVVQVGLWDERFNSIEFQEIDYFNRQKAFNSLHCSINDFHHGRVWNQEIIGISGDQKDIDNGFVWRSSFLDPSIHAQSHINHDMNFNLLKSKYNNALDFYNFSNYKNKQTVLYPYFEYNIDGLPEKYEMLGFQKDA